MPFTKDLIIATTVLVGCCLLLFLTLSEPSGGQGGTVDVPGGTELALGSDRQTPPPPDEPPSPPRSGGGTLASGGGSSLDFGFADVDVPLDEPLIARGPSQPSLAPAGSASRPPSRPPARDASASPFSDPSLLDNTVVTPPSPPIRSATPAPLATPLASARPAPSPGGAGGGRSHAVATGETLMDISFKFFGTHHKWREIAAANQVDPDALVVGTVLTIPVLSSPAIPASAQGNTRGDGSYVVKKGDSYYTIARDLLGDSSRFQEIQRMNSIDPYDLKPGDVVKLPSGARMPSSASAAPSASPSAAVRSPQELPSGSRWHEVKEGEILGDLSARYYGTSKRWREIADANGISDPSQLKAGQKLVIPGATAAAGSSASAAPPASRPEAGRGPGSWYINQKGDLLESIARRQLGDATRWRSIVEANPGLDPRRLKVGERVWLPGATAASGSTPAASPPRTSPTPAPRGSGAISWPDLDSTPRSGSTGTSSGSGSTSPFNHIVP